MRPGGMQGSVEQPRWPGEKLGLPESGVRSAAGGGARLLALLLDIIAANLATALFFPFPFAGVGAQTTLTAAWVVLTVPSVAFFGFTPGMAVMGIRAARLDGSAYVGLWRAAVRSLLRILLIPPIVRDANGRGWHDRATGTVVIRMR